MQCMRRKCIAFCFRDFLVNLLIKQTCMHDDMWLPSFKHVKCSMVGRLTFTFKNEIRGYNFLLFLQICMKILLYRTQIRYRSIFKYTCSLNTVNFFTTLQHYWISLLQFAYPSLTIQIVYRAHSVRRVEAKFYVEWSLRMSIPTEQRAFLELQNSWC